MTPAERAASVAIWAHGHGLSMSAEVAAHFGCTVREAGAKIKWARHQGHPVPFTRHHGANTPANLRKDRLRLVCDCGATFPLDRMRDLIEHALVDHRRSITRTERTPRPIDQVVAA